VVQDFAHPGDVLILLQEDRRTMREQEDNRFSRRQFFLASALAGGGLILPTFASAQNSMQMPMASATPTPQVKTGPACDSLNTVKPLPRRSGPPGMGFDHDQ
jgi:hypothetical protein